MDNEMTATVTVQMSFEELQGVRALCGEYGLSEPELLMATLKFAAENANDFAEFQNGDEH